MQISCKVHLLLSLWVVAAAIQQATCYVYGRNATQRNTGSVVPWPKHIEFPSNNDYLEINADTFDIIQAPELRNCSIVRTAIVRYLWNRLFFDDVHPRPRDDPKWFNRTRLGKLASLTLRGPVVDEEFKCESMPHMNMDESYQLQVSRRPLLNGADSQRVEFGDQAAAIVSANSSWGILRGLETFAQLVFNLDSNKVYGVTEVFVDDAPRFEHRGLLLDTARHYIRLATIHKMLDAMSYVKLNVLHWHIVDDQSFPLKSHVYPVLSKENSYRAEHVYNQSAVKSVIRAAADRGIRVVVEFDSPGHSYPLRYIDGALSECYDPKTGKPNGDFGPVDPISDNSFKLVSDLIMEFIKLFPDQLFHAGGDEVDFECWASNPNIKLWLQSHNMSGEYSELANIYIRKLHLFLTKNSKIMLAWQEVYDNNANLSKQVVFQVWKYMGAPRLYMDQLARIVKDGHRAILSSCWYLNYIHYGQDWVEFYKCDPRGLPVQDQDAHRVLGGEITMWSEFADDTNIETRTWPRAAAAAERLWSPAEVTRVDLFLHRLEQLRCRLLYRGIRSEPVNGAGYC